MSVFDDFAKVDVTQLAGEKQPRPELIDWLHGQVGIEKPEDIHHRIGTGPADAAAGNHTHVTSGQAAALTDITAAATGTQIAAAVNAINAILRGMAPQ